MPKNTNTTQRTEQQAKGKGNNRGGAQPRRGGKGKGKTGKEQEEQTVLQTPSQEEQTALETPSQEEQTALEIPSQEEQTALQIPSQEEQTSLQSPLKIPPRVPELAVAQLEQLPPVEIFESTAFVYNPGTPRQVDFVRRITPECSPRSPVSPVNDTDYIRQVETGDYAEETTPLLAKSKRLSVSLAGEKIKVYYVHTKDGIMEIVANVGDRLVYMKARVCETVSVPFERLLDKETGIMARAENAKGALHAQALRLQDGCISIRLAVEGQQVLVRAKVSETINLAKAKSGQMFDAVDNFTSPMRSKATAFCDSSKAKVCQPFQPYYVKVHGGVVSIAATVGNTAVIIQTRISDTNARVQMRTVESTRAAWAAIEGFTSPAVNRAIRLGAPVANRVEVFRVSVKDGVLCVVDATGRQVVCAKAKLSDVVDAISVKSMSGINGIRQAIADLTSRLAEIVSQIYGQVGSAPKLLYTNSRDGLLHVAYQVNGKAVVLRIKIEDVLKCFGSMSQEMYNSSRTTIIDGCSGMKARILLTKTKALEIGADVRSMDAKGKAVTAATAASGAVAGGAGGGAAGLIAGGGAGVGCGLLLAPFTLGLSIPAGAVVGAGTGLCLGTAAGGSAGFVAGGAAGYGAHKHKEEIGNGINGAVSKLKAYKSMAAASTNKLCAKVIGHTGGTAFPANAQE